jgi:thymidylate kinase
VHEINRFATFPNCTIILDVDPEIAAARLVARGGKRERFDALETQKRVAANYRAIGNSCFDGNGCVWPVYTIDGELSMDTVTHAILDIVETHLS